MLRYTLILLALLVATTSAQAQDTTSHPTSDVRTDSKTPWADTSARQRSELEEYLKSTDWPIRVFGLLRLERYSGAEVQKMLREMITDSAWQVRCFAIRQAFRADMTLSQADLSPNENEARVIRTALRHGIVIDNEVINRLATKLLKTKNIDDMMLGIEIAAASGIDALKERASKRVITLIRNMNDTVTVVVSKRLAALLGLPNKFSNAREWNQWLYTQPKTIIFPPIDIFKAQTKLELPTLVADMNVDTFAKLIDYMDSLKQRDLDLVIVMDATSSMIPMINQAREGVDAIIIFLNDISKTMRLAFVAYRDHDNKPVWEGHRFTNEVAPIRDFLFNLVITGGADLPEAVLEGLSACRDLDWNPYATRQIILVGDARPHDADMKKTLVIADECRENGLIVNVVHIPMKLSPQERPYASRQRHEAIARHNQLTSEAFEAIANHGGGRKVTLGDTDQLVPSIMHSTLQEEWWPVFDEFYEMYTRLCR
ncbi:MAG: VWA domain-containing protein [Planctomycetes bacterium]|nr:VWA domain-containing protein [Planctomycetota bacterium]